MQRAPPARRTHGELGHDYMACVPGELVWLPVICDRDRRDSENGCGCSRGFGGLASHRATTAVEVAEILDEEIGLVRAVADSVPVGTIVRRDFDSLHAYLGTG